MTVCLFLWRGFKDGAKELVIASPLYPLRNTLLGLYYICGFYSQLFAVLV